MEKKNRTAHQEVATLLNKILQTVTFDTDRWGKYTPLQLRELYFSGNDLSATIVHFSSPKADEQMLVKLTEGVRYVLSDYLIHGEDSLTNKLVPLMGGVTKLGTFRFAQLLVLAAAILGPSRAAQMLFEWAEDTPIRNWQHIILDGVSVEKPIELNPSMCITNLPSSSNRVSRLIPYYLRTYYSDGMFLNLARLSVEHETAFLSKFPPQGAFSVEHRHTSIGIESFYIEGFCDALALACNHYVSWIAAWSECGDWDLFGTSGGGMMSRTVLDHSRMNITHDHLVQACELFVLRQSKAKTSKRLNIAIDRWLQSKRNSANIVDRFIDLRIALEALYLPNVSGESRFRVSTCGAWYLGKDFSSRRTYQKILRDSYDLASRGAHAGEISYSEANRELLANAQDLCREGILKRLKESKDPKWNELVLGKELGTYP